MSDSVKKEVTVESPEIQQLLDEVLNRSETIKKRNELSEESFRDWLCRTIEIIAPASTPATAMSAAISTACGTP